MTLRSPAAGRLAAATAAAGGLLVAAGAALLPRSPRRGGTVLIAAAAAVLGFTAWLVADALPEMLAAMSTNPFLVAQPAAGPYVVLTGGTLLLAAGAAARSRAGVSG